MVLAFLVSLWLPIASASGGIVFSNLYSFTGSTDGGFPFGHLSQDADGNLWGTTDYGGARYSINGRGQPPEPAAPDIRFVSCLTGWLRLAAPAGWASACSVIVPSAPT